ncbi:MAG: alpha/beta fold hydrolase [Pseudomonadales bacterium]
MNRRSPVQHRVRVNDINLCVFEWGASNSGASTNVVLFVHATGFHARCWDKVIDILPNVHAYAVDMRGHGRSDKTPPYNWRQFGDDVAELIRVLDLSRVIGVGHSMGGRAILEAAAREPSRFRNLVLVDPVIMAPESYDNFKRRGEPHPAVRRKNHFESPTAMFDRFAERLPYSLWREDILRDYCDYGLLPADSGFELACPPTVEAQVYSGAAEYSAYSKIEEIDLPVQILRAEEQASDQVAVNMSASPTWPELATRFKNATDHYYPELTHFIPMQRPELVAQFVSAARVIYS